MNSAQPAEGQRQVIPAPEHRLSVVVPMYNEQDNVGPLLKALHAALADSPLSWELLLVDDGSADRTVRAMRAARHRYGPHVRVIELRRNFGQTAAMQAGIDCARGSVIATLDGDLQNDPADLPEMVRRLIEEDLDLVAGWRKERQDRWWSRRLPSAIANPLIRRITQVPLHDYGCSTKVFRASVIRGVRLYGQMHRFIPAWIATSTSPARIAEHVVRHRPRHAGRSKYGLSRTFPVLLDLMAVYFFMRFRARPGHFFGSIGLFLGALGGAILAYLLASKLLLGEQIGNRPLLLAGVMLVLVAVQLLTTGVLAELVARTYYESGDHSSYRIRNAEEVQAADGAWKR